VHGFLVFASFFIDIQNVAIFPNFSIKKIVKMFQKNFPNKFQSNFYFYFKSHKKKTFFFFQKIPNDFLLFF